VVYNIGMHRWIDCYAAIFGRILVGGFFLWNGIQAAFNFASTIQTFEHLHMLYVQPEAFAVAAIIIEVVGGIFLVVGYRMRLVALLLALYVMLSSVFLLDFTTGTALALFMQNMAIAGGLFCIASASPSTFKK
jgi:putative oxidoreductase